MSGPSSPVHQRQKRGNPARLAASRMRCRQFVLSLCISLPGLLSRASFDLLDASGFARHAVLRQPQLHRKSRATPSSLRIVAI
jgi:hypothetical protein